MPKYQTVPCKTIVTKNKSSGWFGALYNMNIYRGCNHGCIYCDSRSDCYRIENFDEVAVKEDALFKIRDDLKRKAVTGIVATGAMSDPYNPLEKQLCLTRHALELISAFGFGATIATKSLLVERDIDVLSEISQHSPVIVKMTITTAIDDLSRKIEENVPVSSMRFATLKRLSDAGLFAGVLMMPLLPFLTDNEKNIMSIVKNAHDSNAKFIYPSFGVTLRENQREWFFDKLDKNFPEQGLRKRYASRFGEKYSCNSPKSYELWRVFVAQCNKYGILYKMADIVEAAKIKTKKNQLSFFDI